MAVVYAGQERRPFKVDDLLGKVRELIGKGRVAD